MDGVPVFIIQCFFVGFFVHSMDEDIAAFCHVDGEKGKGEGGEERREGSGDVELFLL